MTKAEAKQVVEDMLWVCQKAASNQAELFADYPAEDRPHLDNLTPWIAGDKDIRPTLIDLATEQKPLDGMTLYNLMTVAHKLCPSIAASAILLKRDLPEPDLAWAAGFED
jgi:hypothetical protein